MNDQYISYEDYQKDCEMEEYNRTCCNSCNSSREEMLNRLRGYKFSIVELAEYLDTHPNDQRALCMHRDYCNKYEKLADQYQKMYGPLSIMFPCNKWRCS